MEGQKEADRQRMKTLLVEAIATLCRNGLQYEENLSVEGLIGITVDKSDVFLVSVKETFNLKAESDVKSDDEINSDTQCQKTSSRGSKRTADEPGSNKDRSKRRISNQYYSSDRMSSSSHGGDDERFDNISRSDRQHTRRDEQPEEDDDIIFVDPNLDIKKEINRTEGQNSSLYGSNESEFYEAHQRIQDQRLDYDPRTDHPSGLDQEQLATTYASSVKQEHSSETVNIAGNLNKYGTNQSPGSSSGGPRPMEGFSDMQAYPVEWGNQSAQDFMSGDDSIQQSPSHQASSLGGASQQGRTSYVKIMINGEARYGCTLCGANYKDKCNVSHHYKAKHSGQKLYCPHCPYSSCWTQGLSQHIRHVHKDKL